MEEASQSRLQSDFYHTAQAEDIEDDIQDEEEEEDPGK
jgi:hypothetical protein